MVWIGESTLAWYVYEDIGVVHIWRGIYVVRIRGIPVVWIGEGDLRGACEQICVPKPSMSPLCGLGGGGGEGYWRGTNSALWDSVNKYRDIYCHISHPSILLYKHT